MKGKEGKETGRYKGGKSISQSYEMYYTILSKKSSSKIFSICFLLLYDVIIDFL